MTTEEPDPVSTSTSGDSRGQNESSNAERGPGNPQPGPGSAVKDPMEILRGFSNSTSRVVQQAAEILADEISAGILAAKQAEERMVNVKELRSGKPDELMQRFRHETHQAVDILLDLITLATRSVGSIAQRAVSIRTGDRRDATGSPAPREVPTLAMPNAVKAGESVDAQLTLENDSDTQVVQFSFRCSDLVSDAGQRIAGTQISTAPATLTLNPRQSEQVIVTVQVPVGTPVGSYSGLLQATNLNSLRAVLVVQVI